MYTHNAVPCCCIYRVAALWPVLSFTFSSPTWPAVAIATIMPRCVHVQVCVQVYLTCICTGIVYKILDWQCYLVYMYSTSSVHRNIARFLRSHDNCDHVTMTTEHLPIGQCICRQHICAAMTTIHTLTLITLTTEQCLPWQPYIVYPDNHSCVTTTTVLIGLFYLFVGWAENSRGINGSWLIRNGFRLRADRQDRQTQAEKEFVSSCNNISVCLDNLFGIPV